MDLKNVITDRNKLPNVALTINIFGQSQPIPQLYQTAVNRKFNDVPRDKTISQDLAEKIKQMFSENRKLASRMVNENKKIASKLIKSKQVIVKKSATKKSAKRNLSDKLADELYGKKEEKKDIVRVSPAHFGGSP